MTAGPRDDNRVPSLIAKSDADNTPVPIEADPVTKRLKVNATITGGGTSGTQYVEDAPADADPTGTAVNLVRKDTPSATVSADGDNIAQRGTNYGAAYVTLLDTSGNPLAVGGGSQYQELATTSPATGTLALGRYSTSLPTLTNGQMNEPMLDSSSRVLVNVANTSISTKITNGTNQADVAAGDTGNNFLLTGSGRMEVSFSTTTAQAVATTDVSNYRWVSVQITSQGGSSTVTYQGSNDNANWVSATLINTNSTGGTAPASTDTTTLIRYGPLPFRYFRLNVTGIVSGTTAGVIEFFSNPPGHHIVGASSSQNGTWTIGANSATGSAVPANAFYMGVSDGANLRGVLNAANALNSTGAGIPTAQIVAQYDDTSPTAITENQFGNLRMSANRNLYDTIRDAAGNERGVNVTAGNALQSDITSVAGTTAAVNNGTASAGTQRVTLASDSTGNIATIGTSVTPGTGATNLGKAEDAAHTSGDVGVFALGVRNDGAATSFSGTNGDYTPIGTDAQGRVYVVQKAGTATLSNVSTSTSNATLLASNTARVGAQIYNDASAILYVKFGATASSTSFTVPLAANTYYEVPAGYTGIIDGILASGTGTARCTEET